MGVNPELLDRTLAAIKKQYGDTSVKFGGTAEQLTRIPTGSIQLDAITGGGFPLGRIVHPYGAYSSGKTLISLKVIKNAQDMGLTSAYYNLEGRYEEDWAIKQGIDVEKLLVVDGSNIEECGTKLEALLSSVNIHVVDSIAAGISTDELAGKLTDWHMGLQARAWSKTLKRVKERLDPNENMIILINQVRDVFGKSGGESPTSGRSIEHYSSLSLHFKRSHWLYRDKEGNLTPDGTKTDSLTGDTQPSGIEFQARANKSTTYKPLGTARFRLDFDTGQFDEIWPLIQGASYYGVIPRSGSWYTLDDGSKVQGEAGLRKVIAENLELQEKIKEAILND